MVVVFELCPHFTYRAVQGPLPSLINYYYLWNIV